MIHVNVGDEIAGPANRTLRIEELKGSGAFGHVWKAIDASDGTPFAVKFPMTAYFGRDAGELDAFLNEAKAASELSHPNIVTILHVEIAPNRPYLVMEFVEGGTLQDRIDKYRSAGEKVPIELVRRWVDGLVSGIAAINEKMLHRDIKPDNILMDGDVPKVADFGLSKIVGAATRTRTFKGGQHMLYMAPEGWKGETNEIQIDMYAIGIVLFEIATLEYVYDCPNDMTDFVAIEKMHLFSEAKRLTSLRPDLPVQFCHVVHRLLDKRAENRFSKWDEVKETLLKTWALAAEGRKPSPVVKDLLKATEHSHAQAEKVRLAHEKTASEQSERRDADTYMRRKLYGEIRQAIDEFNEQSSLGQIEISDPNDTVAKIHLRVPFGGKISLLFFEVTLPLKLRIGTVRLAAYVHDTRGGGFNYLLSRENDDDIYGQWKVCWVKEHPIYTAGQGSRREVEPFGLPKKQIQEIGQAEQATDIITVKFGDDPVGALFSLVRETMQSDFR